MKLKATRLIRHNGEQFEADQELDVADARQAKALLDCGACVEVPAKKAERQQSVEQKGKQGDDAK